MASSESTEEKELRLVRNVEFKIASASTDKKLEDLLDKFLAPLLLKLASESLPVRNKVISICQHINKRILPPQEIKLPVKKLLSQFKDNADVALIRHFDILYIQQGLSRVPVSEQLDLLPILIHGIATDFNKSAQHAAQLLHLTLRLLNHFKLPARGTKEDDNLRTTLRLSDDDAVFLAHWFGKLLLLTVVRQPNPESGPAPRCPGLSAEEYKFLTLYGNPDAWNPTAPAGLNLIETKALLARLLASGMLKDGEKFMPALCASADSNSRISETGEDVLKRVLLSQDLEDKKFIESLLTLYVGPTTSEGALPVKTPMRIKILGIFARSVTITKYPKEVARIVEEGLLSIEQDPTGRTKAGREASKLRSAIFQLVNFAAKRGSETDLASVAEGLVGNLRGFVEDQGWPTPLRDEDLELRGYAYETIGLLAKSSPQKLLFEPSLGLLEWLFRSLREDGSGKDVAVSIEEALSSLLGAFAQPFPDSLTDKFRKILLRYSSAGEQSGSEKFSRSTRYVATRFANRCLPYDDVLARWINILAVSGGTAERHEVVEEGKKGLDPYWFRMLNSVPGSEVRETHVAFPDFDKLTYFILANVHEDEDEDDMMDIDHLENIPGQVRQFSQRYAASVPTVVSFCSQIAMHSALVQHGISNEPSDDWGRKLEALISADQRPRQAFRAYAADSTHSRALGMLIRATYDKLTQEEAGDTGDVGNALIRLLSLCPDNVWADAGLLQDLRRLESSILSNNPTRRSVAAHAYGLLASHPDCDSTITKQLHAAFFERIKSWQTAVGAEVNRVHGAIVALGYYFSRHHWRSKDSLSDEHPVYQLLEQLVDILRNSRDTTLKEATIACVDQLCLYHVLSPATISPYIKFEDFAQEIFNTAKTGTASAIIALGHVSMITEENDDEKSDHAYIADKLYELHEIRQAEVQFSVGEALSCFACGWESTALVAQLDVEHPDQQHDPWDASVLTPSGPTRTKTLVPVIEKALAGCKQSKPALKKAAVIWLLCLLQYCGQKPEFQNYLQPCQNAFKSCLSNRDEVVQEAGSRGLGLVYEKGDRQLKDDLVRDLVGSFSDNKSKLAGGNVTEDTQLFEEGALPTGDVGSGSITTYKDVMNLAQEVGDSSLVYRFMSMASNNSIWSTRAAFGRFGLSNVFSDSSVDGYLAENPKLYPKLYRYRFDPNPNVQRSMNDIWNALVKDSSATIDKHFDAIMDDLLTSILTKEWRVREACCAAIGDLLQGRKFDKYEKYLDQIWDKCFKVLDDIKESVRKAAAALARVLTGILTRSLEAGGSSNKSASAMLSRVLPFLLSGQGLESSAEEVRMFAVVTLLEIVKKANATTLNPHVPELVERLLGLLSSLENEAVNYLHLNASKYGLTEQKLDDMRLASVRSSPLTESIDRCLDLADVETMEKLVKHIQAAIRNAVGLPSKVGCSRILVTLSTRHNFLFKPYADQFLKLIQKYVHDRNDTVSSSYASAAGYLARLASEKQLLSTIAFCHKLYFDSDDDKSRIAAGDIVLSISKNASDRFAGVAAELLPFVFLAKHDSNEVVKKQFDETWSDNVAGSRAVLLYLKEIVTLADKHLESQKWVLKHTSAKTVANTIQSITTANEQISKDNAAVLWPTLDKAVGGKTWDGKEIVLDAFVRFVERAKALWGSDAKVAKQIEKIAVREAKRQNKPYRPSALEALGKVCLARTDLELSGAAADIVKDVLDEILGDDKGDDGEKMDVDGEEVLKDNALKEKTLASCITAALLSLNPTSGSSSSSFSTRLTTALHLSIRANSTHAKDVRLRTFETLNTLFSSIPTDTVLAEPEVKNGLEKLLFDATFEGLPEAMRIKRAEALVVIGKVKGCAWVGERVRPEVEGGERSPVVRGVLGKVGKE